MIYHSSLRKLAAQLGGEPQVLGLFSNPQICLVYADFFNFSFFDPIVWHMGSQIPNQGLNPSSLQWKHGVLTTQQPGKSQYFYFKINAVKLSQNKQSMGILEVKQNKKSLKSQPQTVQGFKNGDVAQKKKKKKRLLMKNS